MEMRIWRGGSGCLPGAGMATKQHPVATAPQPAPCAGPLGWQEGILGIIKRILGVTSHPRRWMRLDHPLERLSLPFLPSIRLCLGKDRECGTRMVPIPRQELLAQQSRCVTLVAGAGSLPCQTLPAPSWILIPEGLELIFIYQRLLMRPPSDAPALRRSG